MKFGQFQFGEREEEGKSAPQDSALSAQEKDATPGSFRAVSPVNAIASGIDFDELNRLKLEMERLRFQNEKLKGEVKKLRLNEIERLQSANINMNVESSHPQYSSQISRPKYRPPARSAFVVEAPRVTSKAKGENTSISKGMRVMIATEDPTLGWSAGVTTKSIGTIRSISNGVAYLRVGHHAAFPCLLSELVAAPSPEEISLRHSNAKPFQPSPRVDFLPGPLNHVEQKQPILARKPSHVAIMFEDKHDRAYLPGMTVAEGDATFDFQAALGMTRAEFSVLPECKQ